MAVPSNPNTQAERPAQTHDGPAPHSRRPPDRQLILWGGTAGIGGAVLLIASAVVVGVMGLPDASDVETLTDFADIESGRIAEHFLYLGALMLFALHVAVLQRLLSTTHAAAALFGAVFAWFGLVIMAASSVLHVSTSPLADLYNAPDTTPEDLRAIEYAWHGTQSVFDTMLTTGALLVPIGIVLFGVAMQKTPAFGPRLGMVSIGLGVIGIIGAAIAVIDPGSMFLAAGVLAITVFHLAAGWRTRVMGSENSIDLSS